MTLARQLPVVLAAAVLVTVATSSTAHAQPASAGIFMFDRAASGIGFTIFGSALFKIKRDGQFKDFAGELAYDPANPSRTRVDLTIFTGSVDMHNEEYDRLLKSGDFFD